MKVIPQTINEHNIIKFQAWADSHVNFPYHERAPLKQKITQLRMLVDIVNWELCLPYINIH